MAVTKTKTVNKADELFNVNGLSIKKDAVYKIENRLDLKAPSGYQKERSTKLPSADTGNTIYCPFDNGVWDTGLYAFSPCYRGESDSTATTEKLKMLQEYVVKPYERKTGIEGILEQKNDTFWNDYKVELWAGKYFNTSEPDDMLQLYLAMMAGELAPENDGGNPKYNQADFVIIDKAKERTLKTRKAVTNIDAIISFGALLSENPQKLSNILRYVGVANITDKIDGTTMKTMFHTWIERDERNAEIFGELIDKCEDKKFEEMVYLHSTLKKTAESGKLSKNSIGDYVYNGVSLGKDLKAVAKNLVQNSELSDTKAQIIEEFSK